MNRSFRWDCLLDTSDFILLAESIQYGTTLFKLLFGLCKISRHHLVGSFILFEEWRRADARQAHRCAWWGWHGTVFNFSTWGWVVLASELVLRLRDSHSTTLLWDQSRFGYLMPSTGLLFFSGRLATSASWASLWDFTRSGWLCRQSNLGPAGQILDLLTALASRRGCLLHHSVGPSGQ